MALRPGIRRALIGGFGAVIGLWLAGYGFVLLGFVVIVLGLIAPRAARHVQGVDAEIQGEPQIEERSKRDLERWSAELIASQENERRELARRLHDDIGQPLAAMKMEMAVALRCPTIDATTRATLEEARAIADTTLQKVRDLSQQLHPSTLDDFGLPDALAAYLRSFSKRTGIRTELVRQRLQERLPPEIELCAYRLVEETMTNISRQNAARSCVIALAHRDDRLQLTIEDDGHSIEAAAGQSAEVERGVGLIGISERVRALDGGIKVERYPEGGTRIVISLPELGSASPSEQGQRLAG